MDDIKSRIAGLSAEKRALLEKRLREGSRPAASSPPATGVEPLAIVGLGCRFPGGVRTPDDFWNVIASGVDAVTETPTDRWNVDELYDPDPTAAGKVSTRWGGFIDGVDQFDGALFGIAPREAAQMDPQQRLLLETAWDAIEHAGQSPERLKGSRTGVFIGAHSHSADYCWMQYGQMDQLDAFSGTGTSHNFLSGRLSYLLDVHGPSLVVDTACSSSLVAVHLACQSIRAGECTAAIVGGVNLILSPQFTVAASRMHMLSPEGRCKTFDASADGFVRSEGCGVVVIKRLSAAIADGDRVLAVIRGSAVNQDGRTNGITAPNGLAQRAVIRDALQNGGVDPQDVSYIEAHGTGTPLGDPIEVEALAATVGQPRADGSTVTLGSVKSNIGHLEGGAGVAGLIKAVLCLHHRELPPLVHFTRLNPHISLEGTAFRIPTVREPWTREHRVAGVSSFGWSGTNAHVVLEQAPAVDSPASTAAPRLRLLPISARTPESLDALGRAWKNWCAAAGASAPVADAIDTAARRRAHHEYRAALIGASMTEFDERFGAMLNRESHPDVVVGRSGERSGIVFVFPGQGSQWLGMGRELYASEPAFRAALDTVGAALSRYVDWSLIEQLHGDGASSRLGEIDVIQPTLFAIEVALAELWKARGVHPDAVVGHSMGEVAAAFVAGALSLDDAARIICLRSQLLRRVSGKGAMAAIELSIEDSARAIAGYEGRLSIAVSNSPTSTVISGDADAIDEVLVSLDARDVFCRRIKVDVASHSPQVDPLRADLLSALDGIRPHAASVPMHSTVTAGIADGASLTGDYWVRNLREPVLLSKTVERLAADGLTTFVEMSPHPILLPAIESTLAAFNRSGIALPSLRREEGEQRVMLWSAARLYAAGYSVDFEALNGRGGFAEIPRYQFQRDRYWLEAAEGGSRTTGALTIGSGSHPIVGGSVALAGHPGARVWQFELDARRLRYLTEHRLDGTALLPASVSIEIALACAGQIFGDVPVVLADVELIRPLPLAEGAAPALQVSADPAGEGRVVLKMFSIEENGARLLFQTTAAVLAETTTAVPADEPGTAMSRDDFYRYLDQRGVGIGDLLATVDGVTITSTGVAATLELAASRVRELGRYRCYPAVSDGLLQLTPLAAGDDSNLYLPFKCREVRWHQRPAGRGTARAVRVPAVAGGAIALDLSLRDERGGIALELMGLELRPLGRESEGRVPERIDEWVYGVDWQEVPVDPHQTVKHPSRQEPWLVFADRSGVGEAVAEWLVRKGQLPSVVEASDDRDVEAILAAMLGSGHRSCRGIVFARALDVTADATDVRALQTAFTATTVYALRLVQAIAKHDWAQAPRIWFVTRGAQAVTSAPVAATQAALIGFARVVAEEHHELFGGLIDLDPSAAREESVADLGSAIWQGDAEPEVAIRGGRRYVPRLARRALPARHSSVVRRDGSYVVTGAFGAVGQAVARWLIDEGARRLVLVGRTTLPPRDQWATLDATSQPGRRVRLVRELEAAGASVHVASIAVDDQHSLSAWFDAFERDGWPPVRGVIHCAAVIEPGLIVKTTPESFVDAFRAKALGALALDRRLANAPLDFSVNFSSIASLLPQAGQGSYAAANAFLDAFSSARHGARPMLSVNWGVWRDLGGGGDAVRRGADAYASSGIASFDPHDGLEVLRRLLGQSVANAVVMPVDWTRYRASRGAALTPLVADLAVETRAGSDEKRAGSFRDTLKDAAPGERRALLEAHLQDLLARVLRVPLTRIEPTIPLGSLGLESLMTLELRNRLEATFGIKLSATLVWNHPTVRALATFLASRLELTLDEQAPPAETPVTSSQPQITVNVAELSDEDALRALMGEV
jgi:myxalamid-type polyketide synthase MxaE and MxaD